MQFAAHGFEIGLEKLACPRRRVRAAVPVQPRRRYRRRKMSFAFAGRPPLQQHFAVGLPICAHVGADELGEIAASAVPVTGVAGLRIKNSSADQFVSSIPQLCSLEICKRPPGPVSFLAWPYYQHTMSAFGSKADMPFCTAYVCF
jgi:hypothetical protein